MDEFGHSSIVQLYQQLEQLQTELHNLPFEATFSNRLNLFAKDWLSFAKAKPDLLFAQPQLHKVDYASSLNLSFNILVYTCLLASRNKLDDAVHQQLLIAAICQSAYIPLTHKTKKTHTDRTFPGHALFVLFQSPRWQICRHGLKINNYLVRSIDIGKNHLATLDRLHSVLFIAVQLAKLTTSDQAKAPDNFALALKKVCLGAPQNWYPSLRPLLSYPSVLPPGSCVADEHDARQLCLALQSNKLLLIALAPDNEPVNQHSMRLVPQTKITQLYPALRITDRNKLKEYWATSTQNAESSTAKFISPWSNKTSLSTVPHSLIAIQTELSSTLPNVDKIVDILEQEQAFSAQLQNIASANSRLMLPIISSRHGLLMNGFDRSYQALLQHCLLSRLTQDVFPLQNKLLNFTQLFCFTADELAKLSGKNASDLASTVCLFAVSYYFIAPSIRTRLHWQLHPDEHYKLSHLFRLQQAEQFSQFPIKLAKAWQQPPQVLTILQQLFSHTWQDTLKPKTNPMLNIIGLALIAARKIYFTQAPECKQTALFEQNALRQLKLETQQFTQLRTEIALKNQVFCSFNA
jgi:hypothetical protein